MAEFQVVPDCLLQTVDVKSNFTMVNPGSGFFGFQVLFFLLIKNYKLFCKKKNVLAGHGHSHEK